MRHHIRTLIHRLCNATVHTYCPTCGWWYPRTPTEAELSDPTGTMASRWETPAAAQTAPGRGRSTKEIDVYEDMPHHIWGPDTQASPLNSDSLRSAGRLIDTDDPALREVLQALYDLSGSLGNVTDPDEDTVNMAIRLGRARFARMREGIEPPRGTSARERADGQIYYIRRGALVKIGTTTDLHRRMSALLPEEVLAVEPGSHSREAELHREFGSLRVPGQREWFYAGRNLQEHIEAVLDQHGPPPADLPTLPAAGGILDA